LLVEDWQLVTDDEEVKKKASEFDLRTVTSAEFNKLIGATAPGNGSDSRWARAQVVREPVLLPSVPCHGLRSRAPRGVHGGCRFSPESCRGLIACAYRCDLGD
jgi:hypothetical protein